MSKRIGIVGGVGAASTIEYYSRIIRKYHERNNDWNYPEIIIYSLSHGKFKKSEDEKNIDQYVEYIMQSIEALITAKVDFIAFAANSPHMVLEQVQSQIKIPIISALESAVNKARELQFKKALLMGIKFTMQSNFSQKRFSKENIELITPNESEQDEIQRIIDEELVNSIIRPESREKLLSITANYKIDGVVLGCMRLPLILHDGLKSIRFIDTLDLHTTDILNYALS
jgi:aspartate racemase